MMRKRYFFQFIKISLLFFLCLTTWQLGYAAKKLPKVECVPQTLPFSEASLPTNEVMVFANDAIIAAYSYNFLNYKKELTHASEYFTRAGWTDFMTALQKSGNLDKVINQKLTVSSVALEPPSLISQEVVNGIYTWKVELPILVKYLSSKTTIRQNLQATMVITRTKPYVGRRGIAVESLSTKLIPAVPQKKN